MGAREGRYGCTGGPIWVHARADIDQHYSQKTPEDEDGGWLE